MDQYRFDTWTRSLTGASSRRALLRGLAALGLGTAIARLPQATAAKKKRKKRKQDKKQHTTQNETQNGRGPSGDDQARLAAAAGPCGPCQKKKKGACVPVPDGTPCPGGFCEAGVCAPPDTSCEATCAGCCTFGQCYPGDTHQACGKDGALCVSCAGDEACTPEGVCGPPSPCETTCPGCCYNGQCFPGDTNANCGKDGAICAQCPSDDVCRPDGICGPPTCGDGGPCLVFVSSVELRGNLGGLDGADAVCQQLAQANSLPGTYRAWLSDETGSPSTRFAQSPGPYVLRNGTVVANDWADLTDGPLLAPIEITEEHNAVVGGRTWSNTDRDGLPLLSNQKHCNNWTSATDPFIGHFGRAFASNSEWTDSRSFLPCQQSAHLYCFQQS